MRTKMAKLIVLASVLLALLTLAEASTYTTITTTVVEEDGNPTGESQRKCSEQVQRQPFRQCSRYLSRQSSPYEKEMDEDVNVCLSQQLKQCCQELSNIDQQCRCEAIREAVKRQQQGQGQGGQWQGERMQQVVQKAQSLPQRCNMKQPQQCQIRAIWF